MVLRKKGDKMEIEGEVEEQSDEERHLDIEEERMRGLEFSHIFLRDIPAFTIVLNLAPEYFKKNKEIHDILNNNLIENTPLNYITEKNVVFSGFNNFVEQFVTIASNLTNGFDDSIDVLDFTVGEALSITDYRVNNDVIDKKEA